jgi:acylpyruvate hydrolase
MEILIGPGKRAVRVGKILCVGRNYREHAREMNAEIPSFPVFFLKPPSALVFDGGSVVIPKISHDLHYEVEIVVLIGGGGKHIGEDEAIAHVAGYGIGLDMTLRDVQAEAKKKGLPWTTAKGFDTAAPVSTFVEQQAVPDIVNEEFRLLVNGELRQHSSASHMITSIPKLIAAASSLFTLEPGDLLFTGTPEGVGSVVHGDRLDASLGGHTHVSVRVE